MKEPLTTRRADELVLSVLSSAMKEANGETHCQSRSGLLWQILDTVTAGQMCGGSLPAFFSV